MFEFTRLRDAVAVLIGDAKIASDQAGGRSFFPHGVPAQAQAALLLRVGLGTLFVIGGLAKLSRLLSPTASDGIVAQYMGPLGYINQTFHDWLFAGWLGEVLTPWSFLTLLSTFELVSGLMLIAGLFVRGLSAFWALLVWSFVFSLPVVTTPGFTAPEPTYTSPALFVQIRDVTLSGLFIVLYNLGSGAGSLDAARLGRAQALGRDWEPLGLLLRLSLAASFLVGGFFSGFHKVPSFGTDGALLALIGLGLAFGIGTRALALAALGVLLFYMAGKIGAAGSLLGYANSVKREIAFVTAAAALALMGGGALFTLRSIAAELQNGSARLRSAVLGSSQSAFLSGAVGQETQNADSAARLGSN